MGKQAILRREVGGSTLDPGTRLGDGKSQRINDFKHLSVWWHSYYLQRKMIIDAESLGRSSHQT